MVVPRWYLGRGIPKPGFFVFSTNAKPAFAYEKHDPPPTGKAGKMVINVHHVGELDRGTAIVTPRRGFCPNLNPPGVSKLGLCRLVVIVV